MTLLLGIRLHHASPYKSRNRRVIAPVPAFAVKKSLALFQRAGKRVAITWIQELHPPIFLILALPLP